MAAKASHATVIHKRLTEQLGHVFDACDHVLLLEKSSANGRKEGHVTQVTIQAELVLEHLQLIDDGVKRARLC